MARTRLLAGCVAAFSLVVPSLGLTAGHAQASCVGPTVEVFPAEQDRGDQIRVSGKYFGDNCYDTGPPPSGQGTLGRPLSDLTVTLVQGETPMVVATGDASGDYSFEVDVVVPVSLTPGEVEVAVTHDSSRPPDAQSATLLVTETPGDEATSPETASVTTFAPAPGGEDPTPEASSSGAEGLIWSTSRLVLVGSLGGVILFAVGFWLGRRRQVPPG